MNIRPAPEWQKLADCSSCGRCLTICPTYAATRLETDSPRGRVNILRALLQNGISPADAAESLIRCALCGKCEQICPARLPLASIFFAARSIIRKWISLTWFQNAWSALLTGNQKIVDFLQPPFALAASLRSPQLPTLALRPYPFPPPTAGSALFFPGCLLRRFFPHLITLALQILKKMGLQPTLAPELLCCGRPLALQGKSIEKSVAKNLTYLRGYSFDYLVSLCPGCLDMFKNILPRLNLAGPTDADFAANLASKCIDLAQLVGNKFRMDADFARRGNARIWWQKPCLTPAESARAELDLLKAAGCDIRMSQKDSHCCGAALNCVKLPEPKPSEKETGVWYKPGSQKPLSRWLPAAIREEAGMAGVEAIVTACPACALLLAREGKPMNKLPVAYGIEVWAGLLAGEAFPWRASAASFRP